MLELKRACVGIPLQRRASNQMRKGRCRTLNCCMFLSLNRERFKDTCSRPERGRSDLLVYKTTLNWSLPIVTFLFKSERLIYGKSAGTLFVVDVSADPKTA
ncbi:hypothetical protein EHS39_24715 [Ensifer sp. MPMI2T]|nr:hypothetical protein EHS39_24715 [Ensifer sp. MPMI2T]